MTEHLTNLNMVYPRVVILFKIIHNSLSDCLKIVYELEKCRLLFLNH